MVRTVIADDEELSLKGIASMIRSMDGYEVVGMADNGLSALEMVIKQEADLLITDIRMPQKDGIWLIEEIDQRDLPVSVIVISAYDDQKYLKAAIRSRNVSDYLFKPFAKEELLQAIQAASQLNPKKTVFGNKDIPISHLHQAITSNNYQLVREDIDEYFSHTEEELHDIKDRIYGWIMYIHYDVFPSNRAIPLYTRNAMKEIYDCQNKEEVKEKIEQYLISCCERYIGDDEITMVVKECLRIIHKEMDNPDLSVAYCAYKLNITPNYLSSRFSRDMHQGFSTYLNNLRWRNPRNCWAISI